MLKLLLTAMRKDWQRFEALLSTLLKVSNAVYSIDNISAPRKKINLAVPYFGATFEISLLGILIHLINLCIL